MQYNYQIKKNTGLGYLQAQLYHIIIIPRFNIIVTIEVVVVVVE